MEHLSKGIGSVQNAPGRLSQSLGDSSFDSWIKFYRPDENANNSRISYYVKGAIVGMLLDTEIRSKTDNAKSLDDVMRLLWTRHRESGYTNEDLSNAVQEVSGHSYREWLERFLETTEELDYSQFLTWYGLEWKVKEADKDAAKDKPVYGNVYVGMDLKADQGKAMVDKVTRESPASKAGFNSGDELISFDGFRVTTENWTERLNLYRPNDSCVCLIARRGKIVELTLKLAAQPENSWTLVRVAKPSEEQDKRWQQWLALPEPEKKSESDKKAESDKTSDAEKKGDGK